MATTDTIGGTSNTTGSSSGLDIWSPVVASASGSLQSVGLNIAFASGGHIETAIYADSGSNTPGALLAHSSSTVASSGWNDLAITGVSIVSGTKYWLGWMLEDNTLQIYFDAGSVEYYDSFSFGTWPGTSSAVSNAAFVANLRMTYAAGGGFVAVNRRTLGPRVGSRSRY